MSGVGSKKDVPERIPTKLRKLALIQGCSLSGLFTNEIDRIPGSAQNIVIGVITNRAFKKFIVDSYIPFFANHTPSRGVDRIFFTNAVWRGVPSVVDDDRISSYRTAPVRYLNAIRFMVSCWDERPPRWFFINDDDTAVSAFRLQAFAQMLENVYGSPDTVPFMLGTRIAWHQKYVQASFGGHGVLFSRAMLLRMRLIPESVWQEKISSILRPNSELQHGDHVLHDILEQANLLKNIQRGPFAHRPFGLGGLSQVHLMQSFLHDSMGNDMGYLYTFSVEQLCDMFGKQVCATVISVHGLNRNKPVFQRLSELWSYEPSAGDYESTICDWQYIIGGARKGSHCGQCPDQICIDNLLFSWYKNVALNNLSHAKIWSRLHRQSRRKRLTSAQQATHQSGRVNYSSSSFSEMTRSVHAGTFKDLAPGQHDDGTNVDTESVCSTGGCRSVFSNGKSKLDDLQQQKVRDDYIFECVIIAMFPTCELTIAHTSV